VKSKRVLPLDSAPLPSDEFVELALGKVFQALEHQLLEEIRESSAVFRRRGGVAGKGDLEAVGKFVISNGNREGGCDWRGEGARCEQE